VDPILIEGRYGGPMLRDTLVVAFFRQIPFVQWAAEVRDVFALWQQTAPSDALKWAAVGSRATDVKPVGATTMSRCLGQLDPKKAAKREISSFELGGPGEVNPDWRFEFWGGLDAERNDDNPRTNYVYMRLPTTWLDETGDNLAEFTRACADKLSFDSGYASLGLGWSTDAELVRGAAQIAGLAMRHPGLDLHDPTAQRFELGRRCVGARWMTLLGPELAAELGDADGLREQLPEPVQVEAIDHGVVLRAAGPPRLGDVNLGEPLPELRAMAAVLEPVTHMAESSRLLVNPDTLERWQRRLLD
jgi:hypothetical protein